MFGIKQLPAVQDEIIDEAHTFETKEQAEQAACEASADNAVWAVWDLDDEDTPALSLAYGRNLYSMIGW